MKKNRLNLSSNHIFVDDADHFVKAYSQHIQFLSLDHFVKGIKPLIPQNGTVLDAGCGDGTQAMVLSPHARTVVGIDISPQMITLAQQRLSASSMANVHLIIGDNQHLPFKTESFDVVLINYALHQTDVKASLPTLARAVRPGGWLVIQEPVCPRLGPLRSLWYRWIGIKKAKTILKHHGILSAFHALRFNQSRPWVRHQVEDNHWPVSQWQAMTKKLLPGSVLKQTEAGGAVLVLWQRPTESPDERREDFKGLQSLPEKQPLIHALRHYPQSPPSDYIAFPRDALNGSVVSRFEKVVAEHEQKTALRTPSLEITYGELNALANAVAFQLLSSLGRGSLQVAILMDQEDPVIPAIMGVLKAGMVYTVINPSDPPEHVAKVLIVARAAALITSKVHASDWEHINVRRFFIDDLTASPIPDNPGLIIGPDQPAAIFFTSGSTGEPKGVVRDHRQFLHSTWLNTHTYFVSPSDRQTLLYFPGFTASVPNIYDTLLNGATLYPLNPRRYTSSELVNWMIHEKITHFNPPVGLWRECLEAMKPDITFPDIRLVTLGGQPLSGKDIQGFNTFFSAKTSLLYVFAMTEAGAVTQAYFNHSVACEKDEAVPSGYPVPDKTITILDEAGQEVEPGTLGRIAVTSPFLSLGYWQDEKMNANHFITHQDAGGCRTFLTNDCGLLHRDGTLEHLGRYDFITKVRGYRIDLAAVEARLNTCPQVRQAVVVTPSRKNGELFMAAYVVPMAGENPSAHTIRTYLALSLPAQMIPDHIIFLASFPLTSTGKPDRRALLSLKNVRPETVGPYAAPRTDLERLLARLWSDLLDIDSVGIEDRFFDLGGESLSAMRMLLKIEEDLGVSVPAEVLKNPTIAHLARWISREQLREEDSEKQEFYFKNRARPWSLAQIKKWIWRHAVEQGPAWKHYTLPYGIGLKIQKIGLAIPGVRRIIIRHCRPLDQWFQILGHHPSTGDFTLSMRANTWRKWRERCLKKPDGFETWCTLTGIHHLDNALAQDRGIILVGTHTAVRNAAAFMAVKKRSPRPVMTLGHTGKSDATAAGNMIKARDLLMKGGIVFISGDGAQGSLGIELPFQGKSWLFRTGGAELAVETHSILLPVFSVLDHSGQVTASFLQPLVSAATEQKEQVIELTRKYAQILEQHWPYLLSNMKWGKLKQFLDHSKSEASHS